MCGPTSAWRQRQMAQEYQNYIGGRWVAAKGGERFERENPATGEITGSYPRSRSEDVREAVCAAEQADKFAMSVRAPVGVVGCITPWNFPMAIPSWKIMPAIVTGNTVVFKPSQFSPKSAYNLVKTLEDAGLPSGVLNLVFGEGAE